MTQHRQKPTPGLPDAAQLRWAALFAAAVMALTCLPYLYGLLIRPPGHYYSGLLTNPDEHNVYLAYMRQARDGALFLFDPFTSEPQAGRVINLFFLALGCLSRTFHLPLPLAYHLARLASGWLLLMAVYCLGAQVLASLFARRLALLLAAFASGLGWLFHAGPGQPHPIDYGPGLVMPEAVTSLSLLLNPLFTFSMFLMIVAIGLGVHALSAGSPRSALIAGLSAFLLGNIHTYDLAPVALVLAGYLLLLLLSRALTIRAILLAALIAALAAPSLVYQLWLMQSGELTLAVKAVETPVLSPAPAFLALGLGIPLALALGGLAYAATPHARPTARALALWLVLGLALIYAPVPFQRKLAEGIHIPVILLAALALERLIPTAIARWRLPAAALLLALTLPSNILFAARAVRDLRTNNQAYLGNLMPPLYLRPDQYGSLRWLDDHASRSDVLLCSSFLGSCAPSLADARVYLGHWAETLHFSRKVSDLSHFLRADTPDSARRALCRREGITYVLRDRTIYDEVYCLAPDGSTQPLFEPDDSHWLAPVYEKERVSLYRVK